MVQLYGHYAYLIFSDDNCDFPRVCLTTYYPKAFAALERVWSLSVAVGWLMVLCAAFRREGHLVIVKLTMAGIASFCSIYLTPLRERGASVGGGNSHSPVELDGPYALALILMLFAAGLYIERLIRSRSLSQLVVEDTRK
jgi:hypothetical protein